MHDTETGALAGKRVLVIGLGDVGGAVASRCVEAGARVTGVRRGADAPEGVELVRLDAAGGDALGRLADHYEAAVICVTPSTFDEAGYRGSYLAIARAFARRWSGGAIPHVLWVSSTAVHGQGEGALVEDGSPTDPASFRGRVLLEAEAALRGSGGVVTAVRLSGIYGPGRTALLARVLEGRSAPATPVHYTNRIHRDDAVEILAFLLGRGPEAAPEVVLGTDPHPTPRHEVLAWLAERLRTVLTTTGDGGADRAPSRRMRPRWLLEAGYRFRYPDYRSGFEAVIAGMEAEGELEALRAAVARERP